MKLGLILKLTSEGEREIFSLNRNESWARYIPDVRTSIKELEDFDETAKMVVFLRFFGSEGLLICIVKARPQSSDRPFDNTAAWIHIPDKMDISGEEIVSMVEKVKDVISGNKEIDSLKSVFEKEYAFKDVLFSALSFIKSKESVEFSARTYGNGTGYSLHELLGIYLAQTEYNNYKSVFFLDTSSGISLRNNNILKSKLRPICTVNPPDESLGFLAYIGTPLTLFKKPIEVIEGTEISVLWKKDGCSDIRKEFVATYENTNQNPIGIEIHPNECKRIVSRSWIKVYDQESNRRISNCSIIINGRSFTKDKMEILESDFENGVQLQVSCRGYNDKVMDNVKLKDELKVPMEEKVYKKEYLLPVEESKNLITDAKVTIETKREYNGMPLKGYYSDHGDLRYSSNLKLKIKYFVLGFASLICLGLLYEGYKVIDLFMDNHELCLCWPPIQEKAKSPVGKTSGIVDSEEDVPNSEDIAKNTAIEYLKNNPVWVKDSLDKYPYLEGLYNDLNEFRFDKLNEQWKNKLESYLEFNNVIDGIKKNAYDPKIGKESNDGKYNPSTEKGITIKEYIEWISHDHEPTTTQTTKPSKSENIPPKAKVDEKKIETKSDSETQVKGKLQETYQGKGDMSNNKDNEK